MTTSTAASLHFLVPQPFGNTKGTDGCVSEAGGRGFGKVQRLLPGSGVRGALGRGDGNKQEAPLLGG